MWIGRVRSHCFQMWGAATRGVCVQSTTTKLRAWKPSMVCWTGSCSCLMSRTRSTAWCLRRVRLMCFKNAFWQFLLNQLLLITLSCKRTHSQLHLRITPPKPMLMKPSKICEILTTIARFLISDPTYLSGLCADVVVCGRSVGKMGILQPVVIGNFGLKRPCSSFEINIEPFVWLVGLSCLASINCNSQTLTN